MRSSAFRAIARFTTKAMADVNRLKRRQEARIEAFWAPAMVQVGVLHGKLSPQSNNIIVRLIARGFIRRQLMRLHGFCFYRAHLVNVKRQEAANRRMERLGIKNAVPDIFGGLVKSVGNGSALDSGAALKSSRPNNPDTIVEDINVGLAEAEARGRGHAYKLGWSTFPVSDAAPGRFKVTAKSVQSGLPRSN